MREPLHGHVGSRRSIALVTGASGFIGLNLVDALVAAGYEVRALSRTSVESEQIENIQADIADTGAIARAMNGVDVVFHLAGVGSPASPHSMVGEMYRVNVVGTHNVLQAAMESGVCRVIVASSASVYGAIDSNAITEDAPTLPTSAYGLSKLAQERVCEMYSRVHGLETLALRLFNVYGPGEDMSERNRKLIPNVVRQIQANKPVTVYGNGSQTRDYVFIDDVAAAFLKAASTDCGEVEAINIGTGSGTTIRQVVNQIGNALGQSATISHQAERDGEIQSSVADITKAEQLGIHAKVDFGHGVHTLVRIISQIGIG